MTRPDSQTKTARQYALWSAEHVVAAVELMPFTRVQHDVHPVVGLLARYWLKPAHDVIHVGPQQ